jgi:hypothetical protein
MGNGYLSRLPIRNFGLMVALWPVVAWGAEEEPARFARAPEIKFEKGLSYVETSLQQIGAGVFGYSVAVTMTPEGRSEVSSGALMRPLKGLEIGLERSWGRSASSHNESLTPGDPLQLGVEFERRGTDGRPKPLTVNLGNTGPLNYELQGNRLRVKYYIDGHTVLSMRARYSQAERKAKVWLSLERRF